jgi:signal transduction histidine kinase
MLLPMRSGAGVSGVLVLGWAQERADAFRDVGLRLPAVYAEQAALALQVTRSREDRTRLAVLVDRDRIGRDLHDVVIQRLFAVGLSLEAAAGLVPDSELARRVAGAVDDLDTTIRDIRRTIFELQSPRDSGDLRAQLGATVEEIAPALGFAPTLSTYGPVDTLVPPSVRPQLVAVLREALTNVARHAYASAVQVHLDVADDVTLTVRDDGKGYVDTGRSSGLANMADRASSLGGTFSIQAATAGGTVLTWRVPLVQPDAEAAGP